MLRVCDCSASEKQADEHLLNYIYKILFSWLILFRDLEVRPTRIQRHERKCRIRTVSAILLFIFCFVGINLVFNLLSMSLLLLFCVSNIILSATLVIVCAIFLVIRFPSVHAKICASDSARDLMTSCLVNADKREKFHLHRVNSICGLLFQNARKLFRWHVWCHLDMSLRMDEPLLHTHTLNRGNNANVCGYMQTTPIYAESPLCATIKSKYYELIPSKQVMHDDEYAAIVATADAAAAAVVHFRLRAQFFA